MGYRVFRTLLPFSIDMCSRRIPSRAQKPTTLFARRIRSGHPPPIASAYSMHGAFGREHPGYSRERRHSPIPPWRQIAYSGLLSTNLSLVSCVQASLFLFRAYPREPDSGKELQPQEVRLHVTPDQCGWSKIPSPNQKILQWALRSEHPLICSRYQ